MNNLYVLGPKGSVSSFVAQRFARAYKIVYCRNFTELFRRARRSGGVVLAPVQNKIIGTVEETKRQMGSGEWHIIRRIRVPVRFVLAVKMSEKAGRIGLEDVQRIYGPIQAVDQCRKFLRKYCRGVPITLVQTTGAAFKKVVQLKRLKGAAIGASEGAMLHNLYALAANIQDDRDDWTEFALVHL